MNLQAFLFFNPTKLSKPVLTPVRNQENKVAIFTPPQSQLLKSGYSILS